MLLRSVCEAISQLHPRDQDFYTSVSLSYPFRYCQQFFCIQFPLRSILSKKYGHSYQLKNIGKTTSESFWHMPCGLTDSVAQNIMQQSPPTLQNVGVRMAPSRIAGSNPRET